MYSVRWHFDPAATGPRRRLFWGAWQLIAYEKSCNWHVRYCNDPVIQGRADSLFAAKLKALWAALLLAFIPGWRRG